MNGMGGGGMMTYGMTYGEWLNAVTLYARRTRCTVVDVWRSDVWSAAVRVDASTVVDVYARDTDARGTVRSVAGPRLGVYVR